ncbi:uncharacterized protein J3R85_019410 [Psidium guajava]|nr:uncharacterized protein J3R85_019410 [Psidium guajava]
MVEAPDLDLHLSASRTPRTRSGPFVHSCIQIPRPFEAFSCFRLSSRILPRSSDERKLQQYEGLSPGIPSI